MAIYLTIDIGNSAAKAAAWAEGRLVSPAVAGDLGAAEIAHLRDLAGGVFDCAAICSVAPDKEHLATAAASLSRRLIRVGADTPLPISLRGYATAATLGADRIAALCGAASICPGQEALVVDCGTAITYDRLSADGVFLGGNIAPGVRMRLEALHAHTAALPLEEPDCDYADPWGHSTAEALQRGAALGAVAEITYCLSLCPSGTRLVLTGGYAAQLASHLDCNALVDRDLVLRGLNHIIDYNEKI